MTAVSSEALSALADRVSEAREMLAHILKPYAVAGVTVSSQCIADVIDGLANVPARWIGMDALGPLPDESFHWKQEAMNRLCQRWRKLGLITFKGGRWSMTKGAWDTFQAAALRARALSDNTETRGGA